MIYFDSCYLAKLYLLEPDSLPVRAQAKASGDVVGCLIGWGELVAMLHRYLEPVPGVPKPLTATS